MFVKCTAYLNEDTGGQEFTPGKVYEVNDGKMIGDSGFKYYKSTNESILNCLSYWYSFKPVTEKEGGKKEMKNSYIPAIKQVIFNNPATIIKWADGTKTVVKCGIGDTYSDETGLAMAISKKALGNKGNFNEVFKTYLDNYPDKEDNKGNSPICSQPDIDFVNLLSRILVE